MSRSPAGAPHRHGPWVHRHPHAGSHARRWPPRSRSVARGHGYSHELAARTALRSRAGLQAVALSLGLLGLTAAKEAVVFVFSGSVALLADLIHNAGDALTAVPLGIAFFCARAPVSSSPVWPPSARSSWRRASRSTRRSSD